MTRTDNATRTPEDAAAFDRMTVPEKSRRDVAEERGYQGEVEERVEPTCPGDCGEPGCLQDALWASVRRDKEAQRMREWSRE